MGWFDPIIAIPRVTMHKLEQLVEDTIYLEENEEIDSVTRRNMAEELAVAIVTEYVRDRYHEQNHKVAQDMALRRKQKKRFTFLEE